MNITANMIEAAARVIAQRDVFNADRWREYAEVAESALIASLNVYVIDNALSEPVNVTPEILDAEAPDAATINGWSDRNPATIVKRTAKTITVQADRVTNMSAPDHDAHANGKGQVTVFQRDPDSGYQVFTLRDNGRWIAQGATKRGGASLTVGRRDFYRDPSF